MKLCVHNLEGCSGARVLGDSLQEYEKFYQQSRSISREVAGWIKSGEYAFLSILFESERINAIQKKADEIKKRFSKLLVFGTGGSSLGAQALADIKRDAFGGLGQKTQVSFCDNVDPITFSSMLENINPAETCFLFVSKSGGTLETVSQFLAIVGFLKNKNLENIISSNFLVLTEPKKSQLKELAEKFGIELLDHHMKIGGRFSVFSNVGLLPAAVSGVDIAAVVEGAKQTVDEFTAGGDEVVKGAAAARFHAKKGRNMTVIMSYLDCMKKFNRWYIQLWAESIGKNGIGTSPVDSLGAVDQHSQLQLYLDGPDDKLYTIIFPEKFSGDIVISQTEAAMLKEASFLAGKGIGDILTAEAKATAEALMNRGRPCRTISISSFNEMSLGALLAHYLLETVVGCLLFGVDPFGQPAVEEGKIIAKRYLGGI